MQKWIDGIAGNAVQCAAMFKKVIKYLLEHGGYTEESLACALHKSQSTINRIKQGQEPRHSDGEKLIALYELSHGKGK